MKIKITLNGEQKIMDAESNEMLLRVLRREKLYSVKCGCNKGHCGNCMVLLDDKPVPSCLLPIGMIRECTVETLEHFKTNPLYDIIVNSFAQAGIRMCGYCNSGKIFTAYDLIKRTPQPDAKAIYSAIRGLNCCCTDRDTLVNGILRACKKAEALKDSSQW